MIQIKDSDKYYTLETYKNGIRLITKGSNRKTFISKQILEAIYEKIRAEGLIKLNIPPEKRKWIPGIGLKKSIIYEGSIVLRALFWDLLYVSEGMLNSRLPLKEPFWVAYSKAHRQLFSKNSYDVFDITFTRKIIEASTQQTL